MIAPLDASTLGIRARKRSRVGRREEGGEKGEENDRIVRCPKSTNPAIHFWIERKRERLNRAETLRSWGGVGVVTTMKQEENKNV